MKILITLVLLSTSLVAETITGKVISVADGDTITILVDKIKHRIRLAEIDAPELKGQPYGKASKAHLSALVHNKLVLVEYTKKDRYGRLIGTVTSQKVNVNEAMVKAGLAWHYKFYSKSKILSTMEKKAKADKAGLWKQNKPVAPWTFRRAKKQ